MDIEELETDGGGHLAPLAADTIPDVNQAHYCFSCEDPVTGLYCASCGQKNDDFRRSLLSLLKETFGTIFGIESRIWRTWAALLFQPGKVAREYSDGMRTRWSSPVRVYIAMSIILFGFLGLTGTQIIAINFDAEPKAGAPANIEDMKPSDVKISFSTQMFVRQSQIDAKNETRNFDLIELWLRDGVRFDTDENKAPADYDATGKSPVEQLVDGFVAGASNANSNKEEAIAQDTNDGDTNDRATLDEETVEEGAGPSEPSKARSNNTINITNAAGETRTVTSDQYAPVFLRIIRNPDEINRGFFKYLPRVMFFMMPFCMLLGAIFIRGPRALLYDHLVHAAYIHAVAFLLLLIGIIIGMVFSSPITSLALLTAMVIYLPLSLKRMFGRGWFKTIFASYSVGFNYLLTMVFILIFILVSSLIGVLGPTGL